MTEPARCACPCGCGRAIDPLLPGETPDPDGWYWTCRKSIVVGRRPEPAKEPWKNGDDGPITHACQAKV